MTGKSFRGCLLYCLNDKVQKEQKDEAIFKNRTEIVSFNQCFGSAAELINQFNRVGQLNPKLSKPVLHLTLSLSPGESLSKDKLMEMAEQCAQEFGFDKNQYIAVQHLDTRHRHLHIVANRIGFDKRTVSDSNNYQKMASFCRKMELKYKLQQVQSPNKFLVNKEHRRPRQDKRKLMIQQHVREALLKSVDYGDFERLMKEKKYQVVRARGIAFRDEKKVYVKGSEIGFSLQTIERILMQQSQRTLLLQPAAVSANRPQNQTVKNTLTKQQRIQEHLETSNNLSSAVNKTLEELIIPKEMNDYLPHQLQPKKKKKQQRRKHL